ncbi:hypothetical protein [Megalodesulfovibrio paquesii]
MKHLLLSMVIVLACVGLAQAKSFNCDDPPFGDDIREFDAADRFIKYMEKEGISYYNYAGTCAIEQQRRVNPAIAYGFVDNKLYTRIITISNNADANATPELIARNVTTQFGVTPKEYTEGDWKILSWDLPEKKLKFKLKFNLKTNMSKSAYYFTPLKPLQNEDALVEVTE